MDIFAEFEALVRAAVSDLQQQGALPRGLDLGRIQVEATRDVAHGDLATNAAMVLAKPAKLAPRELAARLAERLSRLDIVTKAEVAGPGFINLTLSPSVWPGVVASAVALGRDFGRSAIGKGERVNVEYVSVNPTGPLHVGHGRGAVFGDVLANLLTFAGYAVTREYYINDGGNQIDLFARSAFLRYREALGEDLGAIPEGFYPGDYLKPVGAALAASYGPSLKDKPEADWIPIVAKAGVAAMMDIIRDDLAALDIRHDVFFSEASLTKGGPDKVAQTIADLRAKGLIFEGRLPPPKGAPVEDWEDREQTLFKSTAFGDDIDRALIKSDGSYTYFAADMAYHRDKMARGYRTMIDVWGADHAGHIKRMVSAVKAMSDGKAELDVKVCQLVKLLRAGEPIKMSKRAGNFVTLREAVDEVGRDPIRYMMLYRKNDAPLDFDLAKATEKSRDNPVFYVQYAHARAHSVFRNAEVALPGLDIAGSGLAHAEVRQLTDAGEVQLMRRIGQFPRLIEHVAGSHEPHRLAFYLYDLASDFHGLWNRGKDSPHLRFIREDDRQLTLARLALVSATASVLSSGLGVLGVLAPLEMR